MAQVWRDACEGKARKSQALQLADAVKEQGIKVREMNLVCQCIKRLDAAESALQHNCAILRYSSKEHTLAWDQQTGKIKCILR